MSIVASDVLELLRAKHSKDVFVDACKTGKSWDGYQQLDAWAMTRSWAHPLVVGYEIKVSRSDFMADEKWMGYLPYCNELWFAVAPGVCTKDEVGKEVGLLEMAKTGTRLFKRKKATYRNVKIPDDLYRYILMARSTIIAPQGRRIWEDNSHENNLRFWRRWLADKKDARDLGHMVSGSIRRLYETNVVAVRDRQHDLEHEMTSYRKLEAALAEAGLDADDLVHWNSTLKEAMVDVVAPGLARTLRLLKQQVKNTEDVLAGVNKEARST